MKTILLLCVLAMPLFAWAEETPQPSGTFLDGTEWLIGEKDSKKAEVLLFGHGKFTSTGCVPYGFYPTTYTATQKDGKVYWMAKAKNAKGEEMSWWGNVSGDSIQLN